MEWSDKHPTQTRTFWLILTFIGIMGILITLLAVLELHFISQFLVIIAEAGGLFWVFMEIRKEPFSVGNARSIVASRYAHDWEISEHNEAGCQEFPEGAGYWYYQLKDPIITFKINEITKTIVGVFQVPITKIVEQAQESDADRVRLQAYKESFSLKRDGGITE